MTIAKLPFTEKPYQNVDDISIENNRSDELIDGYMDETGSTLTRPGLKAHIDLGTNRPVDGLFWWTNTQNAYAVSGGRTFKITDLNGSFTELTGDTINSGIPVKFTNTADRVLIANRSRIIETDGTATTSFITDPDSPQLVTHLGFLDGFILANEFGTQTLKFSDPLDPTNWRALDFAEAESLPDIILAFVVNFREIVMMGRLSTDVFFNDGQSPFSRLSGAFTERGIVSPYSLIKANNTVYWLDQEHRISALAGRQAKVVSTPFDKLISTFSRVQDVIGMNITVGGKAWYALTFPAQNITLVYDYLIDAWYRWGLWDSQRAVYDRWLGNCNVFAEGFNQHLVGSRIDGKIFLMQLDESRDDGNEIRVFKRTGFIDHGNYAKKRARELRFKIRRGSGSSSLPAPILMVRWKIDGEIGFRDEVTVNLGKLGDKEFFGRLFRIGIYRSIQIQVTLTDEVPLTLVSAEMDFEQQER